MRLIRRSGRSATVRIVPIAAADAVALAALRPQPALLHDLAAPHRWLATVGPDAATAELAQAAIWLAALWLAVGLAASVGSYLPGAFGRAARRAARIALPKAVYRLVAGAAGLGVVLSPALAGATAPSKVVTPSPAWPTDSQLSAPVWPAVPTTTLVDRPPPAPSPAQPSAQPAPVDAAPATRTATSVVVAPGDSLWHIASAALPKHSSARRIARDWPRWYAANRAEIGSDPNRITPGQVLAVPTPSPAP
jgi:hypothetical protein